MTDDSIIVGGWSNNSNAWGTISYSEGQDCSAVTYPDSSITTLYGINAEGQLTGTYSCAGYYCVFYAVPQ